MYVSRQIILSYHLGSGDSSVVECQTYHHQKVSGSSPGESSRRFFLQGQLSVLTLILVSVPPLCYCSNMLKIPVILPKVQVAGYS